MIAIALCALLLIAVSVMTASAATLNSYEQSIINELKASVSKGNETMFVPQAYFTYVENYFKQNDVDLSEAQATAIKAEIATAKSTILAGGKLSYNDMTNATRQAVLTNIENSATAIDLRAEFDVEDKTVALYSASAPAESQPVLAPMDVTKVKATGSSMSLTTIIVASLSVVAAFGLCAVIAKKAKAAAAA